MPSPFPGMDPYLENPALWSEVHNRLIVAIANALETQLNPSYRVAIERRTYLALPEDSILVGIPDVVVAKRSNSESQPETQPVQTLAEPKTAVQATVVTLPIPTEVRESYLEIRDIATGYVVTAIEILSPINKATGKGREKYLSKRMKILGSPTHLVEIDLLRQGEPMPALGQIHQGMYRVLVSRGDRRPTAELWAFDLQQLIPQISIPLRAEETEPVMDLKRLLEQVYEQARYGLAIDYTKAPTPPLSEADENWTDNLLKQANMS